MPKRLSLLLQGLVIGLAATVIGCGGDLALTQGAAAPAPSMAADTIAEEARVALVDPGADCDGVVTTEYATGDLTQVVGHYCYSAGYFNQFIAPDRDAADPSGASAPPRETGTRSRFLRTR